MKRQGRDWLGVALAAAGVVGAISLAGIFIVYLVDSLDDDNGSKPAASTPLGGARTGPTAGTGPTGGNNGTTGRSKSKARRTKSGATGATSNGSAAAKIPDGQKYETYTNRTGGYSILVPKGWKKKGKGKFVAFRNRLDYEVVLSAKGKAPTAKSVTAQIAKSKNLAIVEAPRQETVGGNSAIVAVVRNRRAKIVIYRYHLGSSKKIGTILLGTPEAASKDNADDFRRIASSFRWL